MNSETKNISKVDSRHEKICEMLKAKNVVTLAEFCETFGCSESTIRNDLRALEGQGLITRYFGGAVANDALRSAEPLSSRKLVQAEEKDLIGKYIAHEIIHPGDTVILDDGTTSYAVAQHLLRREISLSVIVISIDIAQLLSYSSNITLYVSGGRFINHNNCFDPASVANFISAFHADYFIMSPSAVDTAAGCTTNTYEIAQIKRALMKQAKTTVGAIVSNKFGITKLGTICDLSDLGVIVTDSHISQQHLVQLQEANGCPHVIV